MHWQAGFVDGLRARLPHAASVEVKGSAARPETLDGWSDLDLHLVLAGAEAPLEVVDPGAVWATSVARDAGTDGQVVRLVLRDGRRLDLTVAGGAVEVPERLADDDVRFLAAQAAVRLGRGDRLIGLHLTLEVARSCLVQAMLLRDRDRGTHVHRFGSERDALAAEVSAVLARPVAVEPRPNVVERLVGTYGRWRHEREPSYRPDWSGLAAVLDRGLSADSSRGR